MKRTTLNKVKMTYTIDAIFGSDFQLETAMETLNQMIQGWTLFYSTKHTKNKIKIETTQYV